MARQFLDDLDRAPVIALDTETTGLDPRTDRLVCLTLATPSVAGIFHPRHLVALRPFLTDPRRRFLIQHAPFDLGFLYAHSGITLSPAHIYDTRAAERLFQADQKDRLSSSLAAQVKRYLNLDLDKGPATTFAVDMPLTAEQIRYTAADALVLFPLALAQLFAHMHHHRQELGWTMQDEVDADIRRTYDYINGESSVLPPRR